MSQARYSERELPIIDALFGDPDVKTEMKNVLESALVELNSGSSLQKDFAEKFSNLTAEYKKIETEKDAAQRDCLQDEVEKMKLSEVAHFEEMKTHIDNAIKFLVDSPREAIKHLHHFGTTLFLTHHGKEKLEDYRLKNGYQNIRQAKLTKRGLPTHDGATVGSEFLIRTERWVDNCWIFNGKVVTSEYFRKNVKSLTFVPPLAILKSNPIGANAIMSVQNILDHILYYPGPCFLYVP